MREKTLNLLGLMRRANAISLGETNTGASVRAGKAKLLLLALDASENARHRAEGFVHGRRMSSPPSLERTAALWPPSRILALPTP